MIWNRWNIYACGVKSMAGKSKKQRKRDKCEKIKNKKLVKKYPWLAPRDWETGAIKKGYDYSYIYWGWSPGWDKAFGDLYLEELGDAVKRAGFEKEFHIEEVKEKWGQARLYYGPCGKGIDDIVDKYETISQHICYFCGKPDVYIVNVGWIIPSCFECFRKYYKGTRTEEEVWEFYNECICDEKEQDPRIQECSTWYLRNGETRTVNFPETVEKIRKRWWKKYGKN